MPGNYVLRKTYVDGDILSASDYVADHQQHIDNQTPQGTDDYSANVTQMRTTTDHGDVNSESLATTLAGEIERLRYAINHVKTTLNGSTVSQWYSKSYSVVVPNSTITSAKLANGATHIQYVRTQTTNVDLTVGGTFAEATLVSQAITLTRTRVRIRAHISGDVLHTSNGSKVYTLRLKRDGVPIATDTMYGLTSPSPTDVSMFGAIETLDTTTAGNHTYTFTAQQSGAGSEVCLVNTSTMVLEEVA